MIIHINGMPGVGKLTVAKLLAENLNARLIDNHLIIDLVLSLCKRGNPEYIDLIKKFTDVVLANIAENSEQIFIFTNALATELGEDRERFSQISRFADENKIPFVQILLFSELSENKRRVISENRKLKGKLIDAEQLENLYKNYSIYHPPNKFSLEIDTTNHSAKVVAEQIESYLEKIKPF